MKKLLKKNSNYLNYLNLKKNLMIDFVPIQLLMPLLFVVKKMVMLIEQELPALLAELTGAPQQS